MPLARIFTHHPERTTSLSGELQQQGYQVEVRSPDQIHLAPADLEIEFEVCDRADVLERAASLADELQADVAVAPGVLQPIQQNAAEALPAAETAVPKPIDLKPIAPNPIDSRPLEIVPVDVAAEEHAPEDRRFEERHFEDRRFEDGGVKERDPEREFEAAFSAARPELPVEMQLPPMIENPVTEYAPLPPVAFAEEPAPMRAEPVVFPVHESAAHEPAIHQEAAQPDTLEETARAADPVPYLAQLKPFSHAPTQAEESGYRAVDETSRESEANAAGTTKTAAPGIGRSAANIFSTAMAGAKSASASTAESFRGWLQEYKKRAQVRSAEARAARVARMLDLEQRNAEAQQRAAELEAARQAAAARLVELVRQRDPGLHETRPPKEGLREESWSEARKEPAAKPSPYRSPVESLRHASIAGLRTRPRRPLSPQLRAVLTGAAAISVLFVIGIVLGALYPRTPVAHPAAGNAANGVTVQGGGVTVQTDGATATTGAPAAQPAPAKPQPSASSAQPPAPEKPSPRGSQARHVAAQQGESTIGDDVVIRHYSRPVPTEKPKQSGQQAGLKHFSDMEN
jgi:hypothetical protein